jgi:hypothetical protein
MHREGPAPGAEKNDELADGRCHRHKDEHHHDHRHDARHLPADEQVAHDRGDDDPPDGPADPSLQFDASQTPDAADFAFFVEVLSAIYRSEYAPERDETLSDEQREQQAKIATQAYTLLHSWRRVPGTTDTGIDGAALEEWVKKARLFCEQAGRLSIGDQKIGEVLAHCRPDPDGTWPCAAVRDVIEITRSRHLETGLSVSVTNKRSVTTRSPTGGGILERDEARSFREWGAATRLEWPRTSALLQKIAAQYENEAKYHDDSAERFQW